MTFGAGKKGGPSYVTRQEERGSRRHFSGGGGKRMPEDVGSVEGNDRESIRGGSTGERSGRRSKAGASARPSGRFNPQREEGFEERRHRTGRQGGSTGVVFRSPVLKKGYRLRNFKL